MPISYPVDVANTRWAVLKQSTGEIVARNKTWPVADGSAIPGLDPDFVYLLQSAATPPDYDSRFYRLVSTETPDVAENTLTKTYSTEKRDVAAIKAAAANVEANQFTQHFPVEKVARDTAVALGLIIYFVIDNQTIPAKYRPFVDRYLARVKDKILPNIDRLKQIEDDIDNDLEPDLDSGWAAPDPIDE